MTLPVAIRPADSGDVGLIYSSWLKSYWDARPPALRGVPREVFFSDHGHHGVITRLLPRSSVLVACEPEDPSEIYGWLCASPRALHYVYVKELWRRKHVATRLINAIGSWPMPVSHVTEAFTRHLAKDVRLDPYAMMEA